MFIKYLDKYDKSHEITGPTDGDHQNCTVRSIQDPTHSQEHPGGEIK